MVLYKAYIGHDRMMAKCSRKRVMEDGTSSNCSNDHPNHCPCPRMRVMDGGSGSYGSGSYPGQRPCPRKRVMGGSSSFGPTPLPAKAGDGGGVIKLIIYLDGPKRWDYVLEVYTARVDTGKRDKSPTMPFQKSTSGKISTFGTKDVGRQKRPCRQ